LLFTTTEGAEAVGTLLSVTTVEDTVLLSAPYTGLQASTSSATSRYDSIRVIYPTSALYASITITIAAIAIILLSFIQVHAFFIVLFLYIVRSIRYLL